MRAFGAVHFKRNGAVKPSQTVLSLKRGKAKRILFLKAACIYRGMFQILSRWKSLLESHGFTRKHSMSKTGIMYLKRSMYLIATTQIWIQYKRNCVASEH